MPKFSGVYFKMSQGGEIDTRGPWNDGPEWEFVSDPQPAVDGGDGLATVNVDASDVEVLQAMAARTASDVASNPLTGADLGAGRPD